MNQSKWLGMFREAALAWWAHNAFRYGAALAYYTVVSMAPLMIVVLGVAQLVFGREQAEGQILGQVRDLVGPAGVEVVRAVTASTAEAGVVPGVLGAVTLVVGILAVFLELQSALNALWGVQRRPEADLNRKTVWKWTVSLAIVLAVGFLLLTSLVITAVLAALVDVLAGWNPGLVVLWHLLHLVLSFLVIAVMFGLMFKYLPDASIAWRDVWVGGALTALLFLVGKFAIGLYLGNSGIASPYGAAGSLVVVLVWVYYSALIFYFGAEVTRAYARHFGAGIQPAADAAWADPAAAASPRGQRRRARL